MKQVNENEKATPYEEALDVLSSLITKRNRADPGYRFYSLDLVREYTEIPLQVAQPSDASLLNGLKLALEGEHQYIIAGLAIALSSTWLQRTGHLEFGYLEQMSLLPEQFIKGLTMATLQGWAQIFPDQFMDTETTGELIFYLDGAHSPERMEVCGKWFMMENQHPTLDFQPSSLVLAQNHQFHHGRSRKNSA